MTTEEKIAKKFVDKYYKKRGQTQRHEAQRIIKNFLLYHVKDVEQEVSDLWVQGYSDEYISMKVKLPKDIVERLTYDFYKEVIGYR